MEFYMHEEPAFKLPILSHCVFEIVPVQSSFLWDLLLKENQMAKSVHPYQTVPKSFTNSSSCTER